MAIVPVRAIYNAAHCQGVVNSIFITYRWDNTGDFIIFGAIGGPFGEFRRDLDIPPFVRTLTFRLAAVQDNPEFRDISANLPERAISLIRLSTSCTNINPPRYDASITFVLRSTPPIQGISLTPSSITGSSCCGFPVTVLRERKVKCGKKKKEKNFY